MAAGLVAASCALGRALQGLRFVDVRARRVRREGAALDLLRLFGLMLSTQGLGLATVELNAGCRELCRQPPPSATTSLARMATNPCVR